MSGLLQRFFIAIANKIDDPARHLELVGVGAGPGSGRVVDRSHAPRHGRYDGGGGEPYVHHGDHAWQPTVDSAGAVLGAIAVVAAHLFDGHTVTKGDRLWTALADILVRQLDLAVEADEQVALEFRLGELSEERLDATREAVDAARRAGMDVIACTGRRYRTAIPLVRELGLTGRVVVNNGAVVKEIDSGKTVASAYLSAEIYPAALELMERVQSRYSQSDP